MHKATVTIDKAIDCFGLGYYVKVEVELSENVTTYKRRWTLTSRGAVQWALRTAKGWNPATERFEK